MIVKALAKWYDSQMATRYVTVHREVKSGVAASQPKSNRHRRPGFNVNNTEWTQVHVAEIYSGNLPLQTSLISEPEMGSDTYVKNNN